MYRFLAFSCLLMVGCESRPAVPADAPPRQGGTSLSAAKGVVQPSSTPFAAQGVPPKFDNSSPSSSAEDGLIASPEAGWPQWRGPRRDDISQEKGLLQSWPDGGPRLLWKAEELGQGWCAPVIAGGRLYITGDVDDDLVVFALDLKGKKIWEARNGKAWTGPYPGARACCAYAGRRLYHLNAHGRVACFDAMTGKQIWDVNILDRFQSHEITWGLSECLLVDGRRVIVTPGGQRALMAALDAGDGQTVWTTPPLPDDNPSHSAPILFRHAGRRVLANCSAAHGFGVDADTGKLLWTVPLKNAYATNVATPVYGGGKVFYVTAYVYGDCYRLDPLSAPEKLWSTTLDTATGAVLLVDGLLYGSGYQRHKSWLCLDWNTGQLHYEYKGLGTCSAVYADGRLYCLADDGRAALVKPAATGMEIAGQFRLVPQKTRDAWAYPVVLDGRLYLRYHGTLWCYAVR